ncbi:hypothetical protein EYF80_024027 [Liparis tanakae]|uniref:Uncharacterized protein n=1 Tax=Liparis tanakae TaxID=230148 RepID=A0A4Z2HLA5_9TELE|nr:hypothetical protein EYF80_024027 [Liparis tanakae]
MATRPKRDLIQKASVVQIKAICAVYHSPFSSPIKTRLGAPPRSSTATAWWVQLQDVTTIKRESFRSSGPPLGVSVWDDTKQTRLT